MQEVQDFVRLHDRDRYLASLFAPEGKRGHLLALYAFHAEIARIPSLVSEPQLAEIRLQWWLDTLEGIYAGEVQAHPTAQALAEAIKVGDIPKFALVNMAKAHQLDFYSDAIPSLNDLEGYLGETSGALIRLGAMILDQQAAQACGEAAGLAGVAYGLALVVARLPQVIVTQRQFIPKDIQVRHGLTPDSLTAASDEAIVSGVIGDLCDQAEKRLAELHLVSGAIAPIVAPAFQHAVLAQSYLAKARKKGASFLLEGAELSQFRKQWVLWQAARGPLF